VINVVSQSSQPPVTKAQTGINVNVTADALIFVAFVLWIIWKRAIKPSFAEQLGSFFLPVNEERRLNTILAQIGVITGASRVILAAFHNGALDSDGYHLQKLSTINTYVREGETQMEVPVKNLPIAKITYELEQMGKVADWHETRFHDELPELCKEHMNRNHMACMHNRLIKVGNLPIGILSLQYSRFYRAKSKEEVIGRNAYEGLLEDLYDQITAIMRQRVVNPGPAKRVANQVFGFIKL
jgi:hypothetical protein